MTCFSYDTAGVRKGQWTEDEDAIITGKVKTGKQPFQAWSELAKHLPGRRGKQIRDRWINNINPQIDRTPFVHVSVLLCFF
jgi:hypothetical protein